MKTAALAVFVALALTAPAHAAIKTKVIEYTQGGVTLEGFLAYDDSISGKRPGVLVIHEWKGLDDYAKKRAEMIAGLGYVAFAPDIYGKGVRPKTNEEAGQVAGKYKKDRALLRARVKAGLDQLMSDDHVNDAKLGAIGYCFGGTAALELARSGAQVAAVATFHAGLDMSPSEKDEAIKSKILVMTGADDPGAPPQKVAEFEQEMRGAKADWELISYGGAVHGFSNWNGGNNPASGYAYNAEADHRSWSAMQSFFRESFDKN